MSSSSSSSDDDSSDDESPDFYPFDSRREDGKLFALPPQGEIPWEFTSSHIGVQKDYALAATNAMQKVWSNSTIHESTC